MSRHGLSVIIPTLNEAAHLPALLADLRRQRALALQVIIADGGSQDGSRALARDALWLEAGPGRGAQMNAGRRLAEQPLLLFLHADSRLPDEQLLARACSRIAQAGVNCAGHFGLCFADKPAHAQGFYRHLEAKSRLNRRQTINGDQGLLIHARFFDQLGGYSERWPFLEDQAISEQIFERGRWLLLDGELHTSARRFEQEGRGARYFLMMLIMCAREAGLESFFAEAPRLYPAQAKTRSLRVAPFLRLILDLAEESPAFWPAMARYSLDNAWQPAFMLDHWLGRSLLLPLHDRYAARLPRWLLEPALAAMLRPLFRGPVLRLIEAREADRVTEPRH